MRLADFGGTDMINQVTTAVREAFPPIPTVKGGVAVIYNVSDTAGNRIRHLNLTADVIARIYLGQISRWNDAALVRLNPGVALPDEPIRVNWRPDVSGTTEIFTAYLNAASRVWRETLTGTDALVRARTTADLDDVVTAGVGGWTAADFTDNLRRRTQTAAAAAASPAAIAEDGGSELRHRVSGDRRGYRPNLATNADAAPAALNSIGYIAYGGLVGQNFIAGGTAPMVNSVARVQNRAGIFVLPLINNVYAAGIGHRDILAHPVNGANPGAYPITGLTWIMVERDASVAKPQGDSVQIATLNDNLITTQPALTATTTPTLVAQRQRAAVVVDFIRWAVVEGFGDRQARDNQFAPLTPAMKREAARILDTIQRYPNVAPTP
jgi:ABC-type phosphate transport system substrate-binding protein